MVEKIKKLIFGKPRDISDPEVFHHVSLVAFLAWVGLGADGLSSSAYGPEEAYRALGAHTHLAIFLVAMTAITIFVISVAYANLIRYFPGGGGGYLVATKLLGEKTGVVSGCALLVDYVLTISVSVASGCDALWSFLPPEWAAHKLTAEMVVLGLLLILNLRGVKESVTILAPIFMLFIGTHVFMILYAMGSHANGLSSVFHQASTDFHGSVSALGFLPVALILLRAYSMGGGTYTGIEAVSNGITMLREPRVQTGRRTMFLMAVSLAFMAGGILFGYLLTNAMPVPGKTMNAVLLHNLFDPWAWGGFPFGKILIVVSLVAEAALLFVAAQTGFLDGPRVLANMALDSWVPRRFSQLSDRLVTKNGLYLMCGAALATLLYTGGRVTTLVVMYSINVFVTFSLTQLGMAKHWVLTRNDGAWKKQLAINGTGLILCLFILTITIYEKFAEGGWITLVATGLTVGLCFLIRRHYRQVSAGFSRLDAVLAAEDLTLDPDQSQPPALDKTAPTAVLTVSKFSGFGIHHLLAVQKLMPDYFHNFIFIAAGVVDSGSFKGKEELGRLEQETRAELEKYVRWCHKQGFAADYRMAIDTEAVQTLEEICLDLSKEFRRLIVFTGKLIFKEDRWFQNILHNETAVSLQRRLQFQGIQTIILPIRAS